ncbi:MAG: glycoside hydrolase family 97 protein [Bacteroidales bacterium]|nr:glycoside hydrolase family 97 protein [Bacteroidales bacterium]
MKRLWILVAAALMAIACAPRTSVSSPDGSIVIDFSLMDGVPQYAVSVGGVQLMEPSALGLVAEESDLSSGFELVSAKVSSHSEVWHQPWGENKSIADKHRQLLVGLRNREGVLLVLVFRAFDDGIGFRYEYSVPSDTLRILDELTEFRFASDAVSWSIPGDFNSYEHLYRKMPLSELRDANTPLTMRWPDGLHASVHEAALYDYPEMVLRKVEGTAFRAVLAPMRQQQRRRGLEDDTLSLKAVVPGTFVSPWRTVQIARSAVGLVNSSLILNLNEPCAIGDVSWIRPMKYIGVWWGMHLGIQSWGGDEYHGATTSEALRYIDFAAANNIDGVLFEGWNDAWRGSDALPDFDFTRAAPDFDVERVAAYAREKGVALITHNETGGHYLRFEDQLERSMAWAEELGIPAVKTGYAGGGLHPGVPRHSQTGVRHFQKVVETAASHHMMVDAHEAIKPTGIRRTWPNFMTRECVRGMEYNGWSAGNPASHEALLPYTRILGGPVDYTPGVFDIEYKSIAGMKQVRSWGQPGPECRVNTTLAHQIADWVVLYSPMQMACDLLCNYEGHPAFQFFRDWTPDCDESVALQGEVGEYISMARRAGDRWFYAVITDETGRELAEPLAFLSPGVQYEAVIYADGPAADWQTAPYEYEIIHKTVTSADTLSVHLAPGGGQAIIFTPS